MRKFTMPQGFPVHIQHQETQGNISRCSGGLGVASSNLAAPTIYPLKLHRFSLVCSGTMRWPIPTCRHHVATALG